MTVSECREKPDGRSVVSKQRLFPVNLKGQAACGECEEILPAFLSRLRQLTACSPRTGNIVTTKRNRLDDDAIDALVILQGSHGLVWRNNASKAELGRNDDEDEYVGK